LPLRRPPLTVAQILAWADDHLRCTGAFPRTDGGPVRANLNESWRAIDRALRDGDRGLPGGDSLPRLLARGRGARNHKALPALTEAQILAWARDHHRRTGTWPTLNSGGVSGAASETWHGIDEALRAGGRGLPGGDSLGRLLARRLGVRTKAAVPRLTLRQVLAWADAHKQRTGGWPRRSSGPVVGAPGESWAAIDMALNKGLRGLRGGSSLARLLARRRGVRNRAALPKLKVEDIVRWAESHRARTGRWPTADSGPVADAQGETWKGVEMALYKGLRGLPGGLTLASLRRASDGDASAATWNCCSSCRRGIQGWQESSNGCLTARCRALRPARARIPCG
jgi:hypothetical protein